jgi:collagenase-like PrtC family protease
MADPARTCQSYRKAIDAALAGQPFDAALVGHLDDLANRGYTPSNGYRVRVPMPAGKEGAFLARLPHQVETAPAASHSSRQA